MLIVQTLQAELSQLRLRNACPTVLGFYAHVLNVNSHFPGGLKS